MDGDVVKTLHEKQIKVEEEISVNKFYDSGGNEPTIKEHSQRKKNRKRQPKMKEEKLDEEHVIYVLCGGSPCHWIQYRRLNN